MKKSLTIIFVFCSLLLSACGSNTIAQPEKILFVYDISNSARDWVQSQITATNTWLKTSDTENAQVSGIVIDAYGGTDNCRRPVDETVNGEPGNNETTQKIERDKKVSQVIQRVGDWLGCELEASLASGSDLAIREFQGYDRVVIFSDGLLKVKTDNLDIFALINSDSDHIEVAKTVSDSYSQKGVNLSSTRFELWGLGYRKDLSATQASKLADFWTVLLTNLNVSAGDIYTNSNLP